MMHHVENAPTRQIDRRTDRRQTVTISFPLDVGIVISVNYMIVDNSTVYLTRIYRPHCGVTPLKFRRDPWHQNWSPWAIVRHLAVTQTCDRQTDGQTDTR